MSVDNKLCFERDFLTWFRRGGGGLCAESEAWGTLEKHFGRIYVPHPADEEILRTLGEMADEPSEAFLLVLIGMPGSGKTLLLKELISGAKQNHFSANCARHIEKIVNTYEFRDVADILLLNKRKEKNDYPTKKRVVWVTTALDDFIDTSSESKDFLKSLTEELRLGMGRGESVIVFGNRGILGDVMSYEDPVIHGIFSSVWKVNNKVPTFVRIPEKHDVFWIKQFGIEENLFNLTSGIQGFEEYSRELFDLASKCLGECISDKPNNVKCEKCIAGTFLTFVNETKKMLEQERFATRVHDLLFFLWLKHCDVYLTPRALNLFWGYFLRNLWQLIEEESNGMKGIFDASLVYDAIYRSRLPSIRGPEEYSPSEAKVHKFRDEKFETEILRGHAPSLLKKEARRRERLRLFFSAENLQYKKMIDDGALEEFTDRDTLVSQMSQVLPRLGLMRPTTMKRAGRLAPTSWEPVKLLFGPIVRLKETLEENEKKDRPRRKAKSLLVLMFDETRLIKDIVFRGFGLKRNDIRFLAMREKVVELEAQVQKATVPKSLQSVPRFNLDLDDYEILRGFALKYKEPDLSLSLGLRREVIAFIQALNGMSDYLVAPLMHDYLRERSRRNDTTGLFLYSLKHEKKCDIEFENRTMKVSVEGETFSIKLL